MSATSIRCKRCKKVKARSAYSADASRPTGYFPWCKTCQGESTADRAFQDESAPLNGHICPMCDTPIRGHVNRRFCSETCKGRASRLKLSYNLTPAQYRALVEATGGRCPICLKKPTMWPVEHDHKTLQITGVVCTACNVGALAHTYHDVEFVRRLLAYLEDPPAVRVLGSPVYASEKRSKPSNVHRIWRAPKGRARRAA